MTNPESVALVGGWFPIVDSPVKDECRNTKECINVASVPTATHAVILGQKFQTTYDKHKSINGPSTVPRYDPVLTMHHALLPALI